MSESKSKSCSQPSKAQAERANSALVRRKLKRAKSLFVFTNGTANSASQFTSSPQKMRRPSERRAGHRAWTEKCSIISSRTSHLTGVETSSPSLTSV